MDQESFPLNFRPLPPASRQPIRPLSRKAPRVAIGDGLMAAWVRYNRWICPHDPPCDRWINRGLCMSWPDER